jgi:hypothetical protein
MAIAELIAWLFWAVMEELAWLAFALGLADKPKRKGERPSGRGTI